jgi:hypothetical protein
MPDSHAPDFLVFCLCARRHGVVPVVGWPWADFMQRVESCATFAFEKLDAQMRWGSPPTTKYPQRLIIVCNLYGRRRTCGL